MIIFSNLTMRLVQCKMLLQKFEINNTLSKYKSKIYYGNQKINCCKNKLIETELRVENCECYLRSFLQT